MLALIANEDQKILCPVCWEEVSTRLFQRIIKEWEPEKPLHERNALTLFCILTGANFSSMLQSTDENLELAIYQCTAFVYNQAMTFRDEQPTGLIIRNRFVEIPRKLSSLTIEQNMHIRKALTGCRNIEEIISLACAVYLQPLVDGGQYDHDKALLLEKEILDMPIWQTFAVGFFFLSKLNNYGRSGLLYLNLLKLKQRINAWRLQRRLKRTSSKGSTIYRS